MKKIAYYIFFLVFIITYASCDEENYKDIDITRLEEEIDVKEFVGDLTSQIVITNLEGESVSEIDMGQTFYVIDNTENGSDSRIWTITRGTQTITSDEQFVRLNFAKPGTVTISLTATRTLDGKSVTSEEAVQVNSIPITANFMTDVVEDDGMLTIKTGDYITFMDNSMGVPTIYDWEFEGAVTVDRDEKEPKVRYETPGLYKVTYKASREDNPGEFVEDEIVKTGYVNVLQRVVYLVRAVAKDSKIELQYSEPIAQNVPANAIGEFSLKINTKAGAALTPTISALAVTGQNSVTLTFSDQMYSDDKVLLSFNPTGILKDATALTLPEAVTDEPCVYGHNYLLNTDMEDYTKFMLNSNNEGGKFFFVNENSAEYAMKPYQGRNCMALVGSQFSLSAVPGFTVAMGDKFEFAYEALRVVNLSGALERRISTVSGNGSNDAGGNWSSANQGGVNAWKTESKTVTVGPSGSETKGKEGTLYFNFMHYNGSATDVLWVDNLRIYKPNPRP